MLLGRRYRDIGVGAANGDPFGGGGITFAAELGATEMSLLAVAAVVVAYLCIVAFVMTLLASAKRADTEIENDYRRLLRQRARLDDRRMAEEEERPAEISVRRRAG